MSADTPQPNPPGRLKITLKGLPQDGGMVRLDALAKLLGSTHQCLKAVEREITGERRAKIPYRIVSAAYNGEGALVIEIEEGRPD